MDSMDVEIYIGIVVKLPIKLHRLAIKIIMPIYQVGYDIGISK